MLPNAQMHALGRAGAQPCEQRLTSVVAGERIMRTESTMKYLIPPVVFALAMLVTLVSVAFNSGVLAKGSALAFTPESGSADQVVSVWSQGWIENAEVRLFAGFATTQQEAYSRTLNYVGPFDVLRSDEEGHWETTFSADSIPGLEIPAEPGYLIVRADSDELPSYLQSFNTRTFIVTVNGQRPVGAGAIDVSLGMAEGEYADLGLWGWRRAGGGDFHTPYGLVPIPFEPTISSLGDGEFEIVAVTNGGHEPIGTNTVDVTGARLCLNPSCHPSAPIIEVHSAYRVTVQNAEIVEANIALGSLADALAPPQEPAIDALVTSAPPSDSGRAALIAGASALLAVLVVGAAAVGYRRATATGRIRAAKL